jgi:hypothetical protein
MVDFKKLMEDKKAGIERPKMTADDIDHTPLTFGKYKGQTPDQISETKDGCSYLIWAHDNVTNKETCSDLLYKTCKSDLAAGNYAANRKEPRPLTGRPSFDNLDDGLGDWPEDDAPF